MGNQFNFVGPGFYPPVMHQLSLPADPEQWGVDPSYSMTHSAESMAKIKGIGRGKKYNLMAQAIPIYGFGILLYIFYIIYKLTCKGKTTKPGNYTTVTKAKMENKIIITDHEFARLQERLLRTEKMMERIVSGKSRGSGSGRRRKSKTTTSKKEEKLLRQLRQITQLMQESRLEGASPEMEAEEVPYSADWEGYPEETYPVYDDSYDRLRFDTIMLEVPPNQPTAEALAERMEQEEEEIMARKLSIVQEEDEEEEEEEEEEEDGEEEEEEDEDKEEEVEEVEEDIEEEEEAEKRLLLSLPSSQPTAERKPERLGLEVSKELQCHNGQKKQISFSDHRDVFHYPKEATYEEEEEEKEDEVEEEDEGTEVEEEEEADEDDPVMEAESLQFGCEGCPNPEEEAEEDDEEYLLMSAPVEGDGRIHANMPKEVGVSGLRMRNRRET
ncbi:protein RIC-3 isoform X2 [Siniperca chuatsi]|uniref:protein RIC-3 isoform X2 n=1 Tax=Siniperca chuatsi TaxID=119488 RepID=UPI001CE03757|nr:protein RIC-3 isoform X2 [Siniperca chuatsi]